MKTKLIVAAVMTTLSFPISAEVYKCGNVYQQSPCAGQVDTASPMKLNLKDTGNGDTRKLHGETLTRGTVMVGMTREDVIWSWGEPTKINDSFVAGSKHEQWVYDRGNFKAQYLYLENGILKSWQNTN